MRIPNSWRKWLSKLSTIAVLLLLLVGIYLLFSKSPDSGLYVRFLDVGQGDSELIQTSSGQNILIDGGPDNTVISRLDNYIPFYKREISAIILTHPHADHLDGLNAVLNKYKIDHVYFSGVSYTTDSYLEFLKTIKDRSIPITAVKTGDYLDLEDGVRMDFFLPSQNLSGAKVENINNSSVVTRLIYGNESVLFMGDLESEGQDELLKNNRIEKSTIYKAPHHGSKDSVNKVFFAQVDPSYAVIEVGKDNKFGHPSGTALDLFSRTQVFRTDEMGTISFEIGKDVVERAK